MIRTINSILKRSFDLLVSAVVLTVAAPFMLLIALAIKWDDRGPALFAQERVGRGGRLFHCYKFRTMVIGAQQIGLGLEIAKNDERITRVGKFLRLTTLDELPQIWNVLTGDMSIVGPRPTVASQVERYTPHQRRRLLVQPGMAGWAWIHGRNRLPWSERIELDIWYVDHWSFPLDLYILLKAFWLLVRREGIYGEDGIARDLDKGAQP